MFEKLLTSARFSLLSSTRRQRLKFTKILGCSAKGRIRLAVLSSLESKPLLSQLKLNSMEKTICLKWSPLFLKVKLAKYHFERVSLKKFHQQLSPAGRQTSQLVLIVLNSKDCITSVKKYPNDGATCHSYTLILLAKRYCPQMPPSSPEFVMHWIQPVYTLSLYFLNFLLLPFQ